LQKKKDALASATTSMNLQKLAKALSRVLTILFFLLYFLQNASAAKTALTGKVVTDKNQPAAFVTIHMEGTTKGTTADEWGHFILTNIPSGHQVLLVSGLGSQKSRTPVNVESDKVTTIEDIVLNENHELAEIIVHGKTETDKQQEQAYSISVVNAKKAYNTSAGLGNLINKTTGVRIREAGGLGSDYNFTLNGFSGKQVKLFMDGIPMDHFGSSLGLNSLSTSMVDRVEVYKGVLPVSLGADALGGAVNIVSRKDANYLDVSYALGSFNTRKISLDGAVTHANTGITFRINTFYNSSDNNYKVFVPILNLQTNKKQDAQWVERFHDAYQSVGMKLETGVTGKNFADYLMAGLILSANDNHIQNGVTMETVFGAKKATGRSMIPSIRYKKSDLGFKGLDLTFYGAYNNSEKQYIDTVARRYNWLGEWVPKASSSDGETTRSQYRSVDKEWLANSNLSYRISEHHSFSLNQSLSDLEHKASDVEDPDNASYKIPQHLTKHTTGIGWTSEYKSWNATLFAKRYQMKGQSFEYRNQFTDSARLEKIATNQTKYGYGMATTWFVKPSMQIKASYEHTYRMPEGSEMFGDGLFNVRNSGLKPESSDNFNIGILHKAVLTEEQSLTSEASLLFRDSKDFIQKELKDPSTQYINLGNVLTSGIEGGLKYNWKELVRANVTMTYQNIMDNAQYIYSTSFVGAGKSKNLTYRDRLPNIPYLFGNANLGSTLQNVFSKGTSLSMDYSLSWVEAYFLSWPSLGSRNSKAVIPEQLSHHISLGYSLKGGTYNIYAECNNLTDELLFDNYMLQKPGRSFTLKFRYYIHR